MARNNENLACFLAYLSDKKPNHERIRQGLEQFRSTMNQRQHFQPLTTTVTYSFPASQLDLEGSRHGGVAFETHLIHT